LAKVSKTLEERVAALEASNKPKMTSFFSNNLDKFADAKLFADMKRKLDLLERRVKIIEDQHKRIMKNE